MKKNILNTYYLMSLPTVILFFGMLLFYAQIVFQFWKINSTASMALASAVTYLICFSCLRYLVKTWVLPEWQRCGELSFSGLFLSTAFKNTIAAIVLFLICFHLFSCFKPAFLIQETDFLNYHLLLPKQHWLNGNWLPIQGSKYEFLSLPIQYGLSFLWVGLPMLNKLIQGVIVVFLFLKIIFIGQLLAMKFSKEWTISLKWPSEDNKGRSFFCGVLALAIFLSFRSVAIQLGTGMLDLVNLYFMLSLVCDIWIFTSFTTTSTGVTAARPQLFILLGLIGIDFAASWGQKSFGFALVALLLLVTFINWKVLLQVKVFPIVRQWRKPLLACMLGLFFLWLPGAIRSLLYTGDPFFPVFDFLTNRFCGSFFEDTYCTSIIEFAQAHHGTLTQYGLGHNLVSFIKTIFLLPFAKSVGLNGSNVFDYPLGLSWYLSLGVVFYAAYSFKNSTKRFSGNQQRVLLLVVYFLAFYILWFIGSHQARWLYPCLLVLSLAASFVVLEIRLPWKQYSIAGILGLTIFFLTAQAIRVVYAQRDSLLCFGESCLKRDMDLWTDYRQPCPQYGQKLRIHGIQNRAYLNCPIELAK